jgi:NADPH-dependent curcumin reductase CurA
MTPLPINHFWTRSARPLGPWPDPQDFTLAKAPMPEPGPGQALTRTIYVSLDPYQWGYLKRGADVPGSPCHARTVAQVTQSRIDGLAPGDFVFNTNGWSLFGLMGEGVARPGYMKPRKLDPALGRISLAVGVLGMLGLTAYAGMNLLGAPRPGETVVVSAASGGVGQIAGQLARLNGARVVGIAGREQKRRYVVEALGFDACVSHLDDDFPDALRDACPGGVDVYFENVGGAVFDAVLPLFNPSARLVICGLIAHYGEPDGASARAGLMARGQTVFQTRGVTVKDLFVGDFVDDHQDVFLKTAAGHVSSGALRYREDIRQGLEVLPVSFCELLRGDNFGKMLVQVGEDPTLADGPPSRAGSEPAPQA